MLKATWRNVFAHKLRLFLSAFAVILGVAFVAGSYIFTDTLDRAFTGLTSGAVGDVIVQPGSSDDEEASGPGALGTRTVPASLVDELGAVPGAARADGRVSNFGTFVVGKDGKLIGGQGPPGIAVNRTEGPAANGIPSATLESGRWPEAPDEVVLDPSTARKAGYLLGERIPLVTTSEVPRIEVTYVGTASFGASALVGASVVMLETSKAQEVYLGGEDAFSAVWVTAAPGTSQEQLLASVKEVLPEGFRAATGDATSERASTRIDEALSFVTTFLLVFAGVALTVGAFLIVNTFSILVAQRSRELALLRAIGASRRQVARSVLAEAGVVGLVGSAVGIAMGFVLAVGIKLLFSRIGLDLSANELVLRPRTVVVALVVGILVTLAAAYLPARRAGRVPPVAAMRDDVALAESGLRWRLVVGAALLAAGIAAMAYAMQVVVSGVMTVLVYADLLPEALRFPAFFLWAVSVFFMAGVTFGNLNAMALQRMGHVAGMAASVIAAASTIGAVLIAAPVGLAYDGTARPIILATLVCSGLALWLMRRIEEV